MANTKRNPNNRSGVTFASKPHHLFRADTNNWKPAVTASLGNLAFRMLDNLLAQYNGKNNGDLCAAPKLMALYGWKSSSSISKALTELITTGFIEKTRQGGRNRPTLYAITWQPINECEGKLDVKENTLPSNLWKPENRYLRDSVCSE